jgi:hypothetical protein
MSEDVSGDKLFSLALTEEYTARYDNAAVIDTDNRTNNIISINLARGRRHCEVTVMIAARYPTV